MPGPIGRTVENPGPLCAAHTPNFPALLRQLGASLLVTTYQAGKLVLVRDEGDHLNTHYRAFPSPMGLALADGGARLAPKAASTWQLMSWGRTRCPSGVPGELVPDPFRDYGTKRPRRLVTP